MTRSNALLVAAATLGISSVLTGCCWGGFTPASYKALSKTSMPAEAGKSLNVDSENGAIEVETWDSKEVQVEASIRATTQERLDKTSVKTVQENGKIMVTVTWPDGKRLSNEGADLVIHMPKGDGATLKTSNGHITAKGMHGSGVYHTSNGAVKVIAQDGPIDVNTSNGEVTVLSATGPVKVDTSNGEIDVTMDDAAKGPVDLDSSNGAVNLHVGPAFGGTLDASTSNGQCVLVQPTQKTTKKKITHTFGPGEHSRIKTSNGSVTVKVGTADTEAR